MTRTSAVKWIESCLYQDTRVEEGLVWQNPRMSKYKNRTCKDLGEIIACLADAVPRYVLLCILHGDILELRRDALDGIFYW